MLARDVQEMSAPAEGDVLTPRVAAALERWQAELLDLSKGNRLLFFRPGRGALTLVHPGSDELFDGLVNRNRSYTFYQPVEEEAEDEEQLQLLLARDAEEDVEERVAAPNPRRGPRPPRAGEVVAAGETKKIEAILYRLRLRARSALQEQGINVLFAGFGVLEWSETSTSDSRIISPLLLVPVQLERETALRPYALKSLDEQPIINPALVLKLERDFRITLRLPESEEADPSLRALLGAIEHAVSGHRDWKIRDEVYLGLFSFAKHAMYADLALNRFRFGMHPVVRAIANEETGLPEPIKDIPTAEEFDQNVPPTDVFQVLDADASQQEAIAAVKAGANLVIQGPPGTGKSQTITNVIAESLAQGKTVLFVSEKMAALRVVAERLADAKLQEFCLEVHSQDVNKAEIIHELADTLQPGPVRRLAPDTQDLANLEKLREQLGAYVRALHDRDNPLLRSAYQIHGELARRTSVPSVTFEVPDVGQLTQARLAELLDIVRRLAHVGEVLLGADAHPWRGCLLDRSTPQICAALDERLSRLADVADWLKKSQDELRAQFGLLAGISLVEATWLRTLLELLENRPKVPLDWFRTPSLSPLLATAEDYRKRTESYKSRRAAILERYRVELFDLDLSGMLTGLEENEAFSTERVRGAGPGADRALRHRAEIEATVRRMLRCLESVRSASAKVALQLGTPNPQTLRGIGSLNELTSLVLTDPCPQKEWFQPPARIALEDLAMQAAEQQALAVSIRASLREQFEEEFFRVATPELAERFETTYRSRLRVLRSGYWRDSGRLRALLRSSSSFGYNDAVDALKQARRLAAAESWLEAQRERLSMGLGRHYAGARTDWAQVQRSLQTIAAVDALLGGSIPTRLSEVLLGAHGGPAALRPFGEALDAELREAQTALAELQDIVSLDDLPFGGLAATDVHTDKLRGWLLDWLAQLRLLWDAADKLTGQALVKIDSAASMQADVREALDVRALEHDLLAASSELRSQFGELFDGLETPWERVLEALGWTGRVLEHFRGWIPKLFLAALERDEQVPVQARHLLTEALETISALLDELRPLFQAEAFLVHGADPAHASLDLLAEWARERRRELHRLEEWVDFSQARAKACEAGLKAFVDGLRRVRPPIEAWTDVFLRQVYTLWLTWRYEQEPALAQFRRQHHEQVVEAFRELDRRQWDIASARIAERLVRKRPQVLPNLPPTSEPAILLKEASKKRRFRPLRKLFADLPHLLPTLKPCMLMSPLSVAQFLGESALTFDVVIFDEASQILPADAIGAIGRGRQLVVVGDPQQLPPTRFFDVSVQVTDDQADEEVPESILDACIAARMPQKPLLWHYRSRHEHLIAFSNQFFYRRRLITFPSPDDAQRPVELVYLPDGVYDRGSSKVNRAEARRIADLVIDHVESTPKKSLGVITFSEAQMVAIQAELDSRKRARPELEALLREDGPEGFFVKNLENVQGDERDLILFSVGYGPDQAGNMTMNFGPLNREGGERRLNVAITRARDRVKIVTSFRPHDLDLNRTSAKGVHLLRRYLEFAEQGPKALLGEITAEGGEFDSPFEEAVADALTARGLRVVAQVGVGQFRVDLGIKDEHSDRYLLGIECDGATYHSARTARERDRLRQQVLERLGWRIHRIWSTDWIKDPHREIQKVLQSLERVRQQQNAKNDQTVQDHGPSDKSVAPSQLNDRSSEERPLAPGSSRSGGTGDSDSRMLSALQTLATLPSGIAQTYKETNLSVQGDKESFRDAKIRVLAKLVRRCVETEGPVHQNRVMREVAACYGIARVGHHIRRRLEEAINRATKEENVVRRGQFLWPRGMETPPVRGADAKGRVRSIQEVAPEEIRGAVVALLKRVFSISVEDLVVLTARELGYERTGAQVSTAIREEIGQLIRSEILVDAGGQIRLKD